MEQKTKNQVFTVMCEFSVKPEQQQNLINTIKEGEPRLKALNGFVSRRLHRSMCGAKVVDYLQWKDKEAHEYCLNNIQHMAHGKNLMSMLESGDISFKIFEYEIL